MNFQLIALAAAMAWSVRAGWLGRAGWRRVGVTVLAIGLAGVVMPIACELAWTGASLRVWLANVVQVAAGSRLDRLQEILSMDFLWQPIHV